MVRCEFEPCQSRTIIKTDCKFNYEYNMSGKHKRAIIFSNRSALSSVTYIFCINSHKCHVILWVILYTLLFYSLNTTNLKYNNFLCK